MGGYARGGAAHERARSDEGGILKELTAFHVLSPCAFVLHSCPTLSVAPESCDTLVTRFYGLFYARYVFISSVSLCDARALGFARQWRGL
jgi:hypothetical protein